MRITVNGVATEVPSALTVAELVADTARQFGHSCRPMTSGAGADVLLHTLLELAK